MIRIIPLFLLACLALPVAAAAAAHTAWFVSTPTGAALTAKEGEVPSVEDASGLTQELDRFSRRDDEPFPIDLSRYQLVGQSGSSSIRAGLQAVPLEGLILHGHARRGFSLNVSGGPREAALSGFVLQTEAEAIEGDALGLSNEDNRLGGVTGAISPWPKAPVHLRFRAGYLGGTRPGPHTPRKGDAWSMAAEAEVGPKLLLRGEFAGSRYDDGARWEEQEGRAALFLARYTSVLRPESARPIDWHIGIENSHIDSGFQSIGNAHLTSDRERVRLFGGMRRDRLHLEGHLNRERNNLDDQRHRPTIGTSDYSIALYYRHRSPVPPLGTPRQTLIFDGFSRRPVSDPVGLRYSDEERARVQYRIDFSRRNWEWGAGYRFSTYKDHVVSWRDADEQSIDLRVEARIAERLFLAPFAEFGLMHMEGEDYGMRRLGLRGNVVLIPDRLRGGWNAQLSSRELPAERWEKNATLSAEIVCTLRPLERERTGLLLSLNGHLRSWDDGYFPAEREYRLFLNLRSTLG